MLSVTGYIDFPHRHSAVGAFSVALYVCAKPFTNPFPKRAQSIDKSHIGQPYPFSPVIPRIIEEGGRSVTR